MLGLGESPPFQGGVDAPLTKCREASETGADGAVGNFQNKHALQGVYQPPRLRADFGNLDARSHPALGRRGISATESSHFGRLIGRLLAAPSL
jgi:hypothetical protein